MEVVVENKTSKALIVTVEAILGTVRTIPSSKSTTLTPSKDLRIKEIYIYIEEPKSP